MELVQQSADHFLLITIDKLAVYPAAGEPWLEFVQVV